jgi:hypothetical protein
MATRSTTARNVRPGDVILVDPLDPRTAADVADVYRSEFADTIEVTLVLGSGELATATLSNSDPVRRVR